MDWQIIWHSSVMARFLDWRSRRRGFDSRLVQSP